jgi:hypothetical protein
MAKELILLVVVVAREIRSWLMFAEELSWCTSVFLDQDQKCATNKIFISEAIPQ